MNDEEVARLVRARARAWQGGRGSAEQSRWAQTVTRRRRWAWLPAITALVSAALFSAAAAVYARGPAPVRQVLAPVGERVPLPWHSDSREDHPATHLEGVQAAPSAVQPASKALGSSVSPAVASPRQVEHDKTGSDSSHATRSPEDHGGDSSGRTAGSPTHKTEASPSPEADPEHP
jgi:hypothetical protein